MFVENSQDNKNVCLQNCGTCPSFPKEGGKLLFCSRGNIAGNVDRKGCKCSMCPVAIEHRLDGAYYCVHGNLDTLID